MLPIKHLSVDGPTLSRARVECNLSMDEVVARIGGNKSNVSRWEQSMVQPSEEYITKLVRLYRRGDFVRLDASEAAIGVAIKIFKATGINIGGGE
jgi:transcriptional regulator with XRE-family HTH domain